jgi:hypothetical protein
MPPLQVGTIALDGQTGIEEGGERSWFLYSGRSSRGPGTGAAAELSRVLADVVVGGGRGGCGKGRAWFSLAVVAEVAVEEGSVWSGMLGVLSVEVRLIVNVRLRALADVVYADCSSSASSVAGLVSWTHCCMRFPPEKVGKSATGVCWIGGRVAAVVVVVSVGLTRETHGRGMGGDLGTTFS